VFTFIRRSVGFGCSLSLGVRLVSGVHVRLVSGVHVRLVSAEVLFLGGRLGQLYCEHAEEESGESLSPAPAAPATAGQSCEL